MISQTVNVTDSWPTTLTPAPAIQRDYDLLYVLPEYDVVGMSRPEFNNAPLSVYGLPPTVRFQNTGPVPITPGKPAYILLREEFAKQCPASWTDADIDKHLGGYLKNGVCYTDHTDPTAWNQIVTCNNVLYPTGATKTQGGELYYEVRQLLADNVNNMRAQLAQYPYLKTWATISTRGSGGQQVVGFPHCGGGDVPALLYCKQATNWIKWSRVRVLDRTEPIPPLYHS